MSNHLAAAVQWRAIIGEELSFIQLEPGGGPQSSKLFGDLWWVYQWVLKITKELMLFQTCRTKVMSAIAILIAQLLDPC